MRYRIHFINGEIAGSVFDIPANGTLSVGRSRSNSVCLKAPDVSGRHLVLTASENGVTLESLSLRKTETESGRVEIGVKIPLAAGQTVKIGSSNEFVLECAELRGDTVEDIAPASEPNPAPRNFDENATIGGGAFPGGMDNKTVVVSEDFGNTVLSSTPENPPMQPGAFGGGKTSVAADSSGSRGEPAALERDMPGEDASIAYNNTVALQTRMASPDELEFMRVAYQKKRTKKTLIMSAVMAEKRQRKLCDRPRRCSRSVRQRHGFPVPVRRKRKGFGKRKPVCGGNSHRQIFGRPIARCFVF